MQFSVYNTAGEVVDSVELDDAVFAAPVNQALLHQAVLRQRANARVGTASTKTRGVVVGTGAKLFRQKGTGRARQGSKKAPHWTGGGVVFGPHPRSYEQAMPRQMRRQAVRSALSARVAENHFVVVDSLQFDEPKTKAMLAVLGNLHVAPRSALVVLPEPDFNVVRSARNIPGVKTLPADSLNVLDILSHDYLIMPVEAARKVEQALA